MTGSAGGRPARIGRTGQAFPVSEVRVARPSQGFQAGRNEMSKSSGLRRGGYVVAPVQPSGPC